MLSPNTEKHRLKEFVFQSLFISLSVRSSNDPVEATPLMIFIEIQPLLMHLKMIQCLQRAVC